MVPPFYANRASVVLHACTACEAPSLLHGQGTFSTSKVGGRRLAVGGWRLVVGGGSRLAVGGGWWQLAIGEN